MIKDGKRNYKPFMLYSFMLYFGLASMIENKINHYYERKN